MISTPVLQEIAKIIVQELGPDLTEKLWELHRQGKLDSLFRRVIEHIAIRNEAVTEIGNILRREIHPTMAGVAELLTLRTGRKAFETLTFGGRADVRVTTQREPAIVT